MSEPAAAKLIRLPVIEFYRDLGLIGPSATRVFEIPNKPPILSRLATVINPYL